MINTHPYDDGELMLKFFSFIVENFHVIISAVTMVLSGIIAIALLIPGDEPEKTLQSVLDFLTQFSKK